MITFRPIRDRDLPMVEAWLHTPHVRRWYEIPEQGVTLDDWMDELKERGGRFAWLNHWIALCDGVPIGMCQYYKCRDSADEEFGGMPIEGAYGIDYLIGEQTYVGRGLGKEMIRRLVERIFSLPDAQRVTADIDMENKASQGVLLSCGFTMPDPQGSRFVLEKPCIASARRA